MALNQEASLKIKLIRLQCHFTWGLRKEDTDLSDLQNRLEDDISFSLADQAGAKHLFSFLAFLNYLQDRPEAALANLAKAEDHIREHNEECEKMLIVTYGDFAWLYYHLNDLKVEHLLLLAIHHFQKAIEMRPSFVIAMIDLAVLHARKGNFTKAEELFQEAFQVARTKNLNLQDVHRSYGDFQLINKRSEPLAIEHYMIGCKIQKDNRAGEQCVQKLEIIAKRRIDRNPSDGEAFGILGYVNRLRGDKLQAIKCYEKALVHNPGNDEFLTALCDLRLSLH